MDSASKKRSRRRRSMGSASKKRKQVENDASAAAAGGDSLPPKLTTEEAGRIIDSLSPDQIRQIIANAMCRGADVITSVREIADRDLSKRKLFIRNLSRDTTSESLTEHFSQYGDLQEAVVVVDKVIGRSKGYGFIVFRHVDGAVVALRDPRKTIDGRVSVCQLAAVGAPNSAAPPVSSFESGQRKVFVGSVPADMAPDRLMAHFSKYGEIEEGPIGYDKATGKSKGYAMFVYKTEEGARNALVDPVKTIDGTHLPCKVADSKRDNHVSIATTVSAGMQNSLPVGPFSSQFAAPHEISTLSGLPELPVPIVATGRHHHLSTSSISPYLAAPVSQVPSHSGAVAPGGYGGTSLGGSSYGHPREFVGLSGNVYRIGATPGGGIHVESGGHYGGLSSSAYQSQHHHPAASRPTGPMASIPSYY